MILSKMIYQLRFVQADLFQHNCTDQVSLGCRDILKVVMSRWLTFVAIENRFLSNRPFPSCFEPHYESEAKRFFLL